MTEQILAFGYIRSSTKLEMEQGSNIRQKQDITNFFEYLDKKNGTQTLIKWYDDKVITGTHAEREKLKEMLLDLPLLHPKYVACAKLDRFARSDRDLQNMVVQIQENNAAFISVKENFDATTLGGKLMMTVLAAFAEFEAGRIKERTQSGREYAKNKGIKFGRPIGKTNEKKGGKVINTKMVLDMYNNKKMSASSIAKFMGCSLTPILRIIKDSGVFRENHKTQQ